MMVLDLEVPGVAARTFSFSRHALGIGATFPSLSVGRDAELKVPSPSVAEQHLRLFERDGRLLADPRKPVTIDDRAVTSGHHAVASGSVLYLGDATLRIRAFVAIVAIDFEHSEQDFLAMLATDPLDGRLVYADALEEAGWLIRAEYLRVQVRLARDQPLDGDTDVELRLTKKLSCAPRWLRAVRIQAPDS